MTDKRVGISTWVASEIDGVYKNRNMSMISIDRPGDVIGWGTVLADKYNKPLNEIMTRKFRLNREINNILNDLILLSDIIIDKMREICPEIKTPINDITYNKIKTKRSEVKYEYDLTDNENNHYSFSILREKSEWNELEKE